MGAPFGVEARCERASISVGRSTLWASVRVDPRGKGLEDTRAPLALALVIDVSGSMGGAPIEHVLRSCELVATLLGDADQLALVTFGDVATIPIALTPCTDQGRRQIGQALASIRVHGSTNMHAGIMTGHAVLQAAPAGLRRAMVVMSDGKPNVGLASADQLAQAVSGCRPTGVSTLGFGVHHDDQVLSAIAAAGSGRYAYVADPIAARLDLARAALAHGGIVAEQLQLELRPAPGVELVTVLPATQLRFGGSGARAPIGDVFVDEFRLVALELSVDLPASSRGHLADLVIEGRAVDGTTHQVAAKLTIDVHAAPHAVVRDAQRDILLVRADAARAEARALADRGSTPAATAVLRAMVKLVDASDGFVANDGTPLAEMREQLIDEAMNYERAASDAEQQHMRKAASSFKSTKAVPRGQSGRAPGVLVGVSAEVRDRRFPLYVETRIGRSQDNEIPVPSETLSRCHARILFVNGQFALLDQGSTNGSAVNGRMVTTSSAPLAEGDLVRLGSIEFRFERETP